MAAIGVAPTTARRRLVLVTAALVAAVTVVIIVQLNGVLAESRVDGGVAGGVDDLGISLVPAHLPDEDDVRAIVGSWKTYDAEVVLARPALGYASPLATANAVLRWESFVLVPVVVVFLVALLLWARRWPIPPPGQPVPRAVVALARSPLMFVVVAITAAAELVENLVQSRLIDQAWDGRLLSGMTTLTVAGLVRWAGLALLVTPFIVVGVRMGAGVARPLVRTAWFPLLLLVVLGVAAFNDQAGDVVRRWAAGQVVWALLAMAMLCLTIGLAGSRALQIGRTPITVRAQGTPISFAALLRASAALVPLALATLLLLLVGAVMSWRGLLLLALLLAGAFVLSLPIRHFWEREQTVDVPTVQTAPPLLRHKFGAVLAAVVPFLVGIAIVRPSVVDVFVTSDSEWFDRSLVLLVIGFALAVIGSLLAATLVGQVVTWLTLGGRARRWGLLVSLAGAVALPSALLFLRSTSAAFAQGVGAAAILLLFLGFLAVLSTGLYVLGDGALRTRWTRDAILPPAVRILGFERPPLVGLLVLWLVLASLVGPGSYHDVRLQDRSGVDIAAIGISEYFAEWQNRQPQTSGSDVGQPMLVVSAAGGGLRSAYWTALVLDCVLEREADPETLDPCGAPAEQATIERRRNRTFLMSGVAGGSLGLITYDTHVEVDGVETDAEWYDARLRDDFLAPTLAWWLFRDTAAALLRPGGGRDRAAALERAWERPWRRDGDALTEPFLTRQSRMQGPLLLLNGYTVEDGCRFSVSVLRTDGGRPVDQCGALDPAFAEATYLDGTTDLLAFLCPGTDIRRSTAAMLSARFPWISPAGRVQTCGPDASSPQTFVVQGGYRDSSGASPVVEMWPRIQPFIDQAIAGGVCIVPTFLQIDDDEVLPPPGGQQQPSQALLPAESLRQVPGGNADAARIAVQRTFSGPLDNQGSLAFLDGEVLDVRWQRIAPRAHAGASAQDGWVLSKETRADLRRQIIYNADTIVRLRHLLDTAEETLRCQEGAAP